MRKIKKYIRNLKIFILNRKRISRVQIVLKEYFNDDITFKFSSFGGADINYFLLKDGKKFAILRLAVLDKKDRDFPIVRFNQSKRIENEYQAYTLGSKYDLTPKALYKFNDGLVCEYLNGDRVFSILNRDKSRVWDILIDAIEVYVELHKLDIVHLDATLKNFIVIDGKMKVIDFEYYSGKEDFSLAEQKAYDYVRIIEHTLRKIPKQYQIDYEEFIQKLDILIPNDIREVDFKNVKSLIVNIQNFPIYNELQKTIFTKLKFNQ